MLYRCAVTFGPLYMCYHTPSLHNKPAVYNSAVTSLALLAPSVETSYTVTTDSDRKKSV